MSAIPVSRSARQIVWTWIKHSPILFSMATYVAFNLLSIIMLGGFTSLALLTNLFPAIMGFFLSAMYNEGRLSNSKKDKNHKVF